MYDELLLPFKFLFLNSISDNMEKCFKRTEANQVERAVALTTVSVPIINYTTQYTENIP